MHKPDILDRYKNLLESARYSWDDEGFIYSVRPTGSKTKAVSKGLPMVLPTHDWLKRGFRQEYQPFHPLCESISRPGTSPVIQHLQRSIKVNLTYAIVTLCKGILSVAADSSLHKSLPLTDACASMLHTLSDVDKNTVEAFDKLIEAAIKKNKVVIVYLKNGGEYNGKKVNRLCTIRFPLVELLETPDSTVLGVGIKPKQRKLLIKLFNLVVPDGEKPETYSAGSNFRQAPYLHALCQAYNKAIHQLNKLIDAFGTAMQLDLERFVEIDETFYDQFVELYDKIPPLNGNDGEGKEDASQTESAAAPGKEVLSLYDRIQDTAPAPAPQPAATVSTPAPAPQPQTQPQAKTTFERTMEFEEFMRGRNPQPAQQPYYQQPGMAPQPVAVQPMQYGAYPQQPMYGYQQPVQPGAPVQLPWVQPQVPQQPQNPFAQLLAPQVPQVQQPVYGYQQPIQQSYVTSPTPAGYGIPYNPNASLV